MIWGAVVGGLAGTVVLTTLLRAASELGLTRIDLPFLLGTAVTTDRVRAKAVGYALHFVFGLLFALAYYAVFVVLGAAAVLVGTAFGLVHALFAGTALVNLLLPVVHPRMGTGFDAAGSAPPSRAAGLHAFELRARDAGRQYRRPRRLRRDRRCLRRVGRLGSSPHSP